MARSAGCVDQEKYHLCRWRIHPSLSKEGSGLGVNTSNSPPQMRRGGAKRRGGVDQKKQFGLRPPAHPPSLAGAPSLNWSLADQHAVDGDGLAEAFDSDGIHPLCLDEILDTCVGRFGDENLVRGSRAA